MPIMKEHNPLFRLKKGSAGISFPSIASIAQLHILQNIWHQYLTFKPFDIYGNELMAI